MIRTRETWVKFLQPFSLTAVGRTLPAGTYRITIDEELIDEFSCGDHRRLSTMIIVREKHSEEMWSIDPVDLASALKRDRAPSLVVVVPAAPPCGPVSRRSRGLSK